MKAQLRKLIAQGKTEEVILQLLQLTKQSGDKDLHQEIILQSARFEKYKKANRLGTASFEEDGISIAKINHALLSLIDQLPEITPLDTNGQQQKVKSTIDTPFVGKWWQWVVALGLLIAIPAGIAEFTGYQLKDLLGGEQTDSFSLTVLVHGTKGKDERILRNQGKVVLDIGDTREEEAINGEGEATFKALPSGYIGQEAFISIHHPQPYFPTNRKNNYQLEKGKAIYLEVALEGLNKVWGRVLDFETEQPLDSVRVSIRNVADYSDKFGWYELEIPPEQQNKFIRVTFYKVGYQMETIDSIAPHTQQEIGISLQKQQ